MINVLDNCISVAEKMSFIFENEKDKVKGARVLCMALNPFLMMSCLSEIFRAQRQLKKEALKTGDFLAEDKFLTNKELCILAIPVVNLFVIIIGLVGQHFRPSPIVYNGNIPVGIPLDREVQPVLVGSVPVANPIQEGHDL